MCLSTLTMIKYEIIYYESNHTFSVRSNFLFFYYRSICIIGNGASKRRTRTARFSARRADNSTTSYSYIQSDKPLRFQSFNFSASDLAHSKRLFKKCCGKRTQKSKNDGFQSVWVILRKALNLICIQ